MGGAPRIRHEIRLVAFFVTDPGGGPQYQGVLVSVESLVFNLGSIYDLASMSAPAARTAPATDEAEFRAVYEAQFGYVFNSLRRLGIPTKDLEDLSHDTFVTAWRRRDTFEAGRAVRPWLFGIAFRLASDFRQMARHRHEVGDEGQDASSDAASPDEAIDKAKGRQLVLEALESLDLDRRAVFILHEIDGQPIPEVALALGTPLNTAYSRLRLGRKEFAEAIQRLQARRGAS